MSDKKELPWGLQTIGRCIRDASTGTGSQCGTMSGEYVQFLGFTVGKGLCSFLLPAAGTNKFPKIPMQTRSILRIRPKLYKFKNFFRRKEQSPFPTFPLADYAYHPKCQ